MCDESFSINYTADIPEDVDKGWFMFFVTLLNHFYWFSGATLGGIFGSLIHFNTEGLDFVMTAMFLVIFMEQWLKDRKLDFILTDCLGREIPKKELYVVHYGKNSGECGGRLICNGCSDCGKCGRMGR